MTNYEFYIEAKNTLEAMAHLKNISESELKRYYKHTDANCSFYKDLNGINRIFAQMLFHGQNATMISNIVKFDENYVFLKKITFGFDPGAFLANYNGSDSVEKIVETLRAKNGEGLVWNSDKSTKNKDGIARRYARSMIECAQYLIKFSSPEEVLGDLKSHNTSFKDLIAYFRSHIKSGFSVALTCDFLKEYDPIFDLPKPDVHIKDIMIAKNGRKDGYYNNEKRVLELVGEIIAITNDINRELAARSEDNITVYQLDRMLWLICTEKFFLHNEPNNKRSFLQRVK
jgi:hypothetical protein